MQLKLMYNQDSVGALGNAIQAQFLAFDTASFAAAVFDQGWDSRELKQRMRHITHCLHMQLPSDYHASIQVLRGALPTLEGYGFAKIVFPDYVEVYGIDDWAASMPALEEFTQHVSAEFAIRPFIVRYPQETMEQMQRWAQHQSAEVRRLSTEGCRPRLPWGIVLPSLKADPTSILPILEMLKNDESESVRRSVANNLNDISKDNPEVVLDLLHRWQADATDEVRWLTGHALRTLLKQGRPEALDLLGFPSQLAIAVRYVAVQPQQIAIGEAVTLTFAIESLADEPQNLMIDYVVHLLRANGKHTPKVFKLSKRTIQPGERFDIERKVSFRPVTTRKYYPGEHAVQPKINGHLFDKATFVLEPG